MLRYSLHTVWLNKAELRKLDAFHAKCLQKIFGIQHSFISKICNENVMRRAKCSNLFSHLLFRQLILFGKVANLSPNDVRTQTVFEDGCLEINLNYTANHGIAKQS